jgi:hypothetical protein
MEKRRLGKTEIMVSEVGFGGIPIARISTDKAIETLKRAVDLGINFFDTANAYKDSEDKIGQAFETIRDNIVLATKSTRRTKPELLNHIDRSLKNLRTDRIDIFQIHQVSTDEDIEKVFSPGGAYEAIVEAKMAGKILHIGVTSHRLESAIKLVKTGKFETIQFPANFIEIDSIESLFPEALKQDMGCIVMKPLGGGELSNAALCFKFLQQYPDLIPIPGISEIHEIEEIVNLYNNKSVLTDEDLKVIDNYREKLKDNFCHRCGYCDPCPNGVNVFAAMAIPRVIMNYGHDYDAEWFVNGAKNIDKCVECGICEQKCPYNLPIRTTLKENKAFYLENARNKS